ncbi:MAG TPA: hypothetical protein VNX86_04735 [Rhizomicrobium sp.]|jgi:hypothetical protein|nr:hypothetical protein [Rhizomicrobium sp.]
MQTENVNIVCSAPGCAFHASCAPRLNVPYRDNGSAALSCVVGHPLCTAHCDLFNVLKITSRKSLTIMFEARNDTGRPLDFDRLFVTRCAFDDPDYQSLVKSLTH